MNDACLDYRVIQRAARRSGHAGVGFKLQMPPRPRRRTGCHHNTNAARLTLAQVQAIRAWAGGPGYGLGRTQQARALAAQPAYRHVSIYTLYDVLANASWHDPAYLPGEPDPAYWAHQPVASVLLHVVQTV